MGLYLKSTASISVTIIRKSIIRVIRVTGRTRLAGLNRAHRGYGASMTILDLRRKVRDFRNATRLILRHFIAGDLGRQLIVLIGRRGRLATNVLVDTAGSTLRARLKEGLKEEHSVFLFPSRRYVIRRFVRTVLVVMFPNVRVRVRGKVFRPFLFWPLGNRPYGRVFAAPGVDLRHKCWRKLTGTAKAARRVMFPPLCRVVSVDHLVGMGGSLIAWVAGALCAS